MIAQISQTGKAAYQPIALVQQNFVRITDPADLINCCIVMVKIGDSLLKQRTFS